MGVCIVRRISMRNSRATSSFIALVNRNPFFHFKGFEKSGQEKGGFAVPGPVLLFLNSCAVNISNTPKMILTYKSAGYNYASHWPWERPNRQTDWDNVCLFRIGKRQTWLITWYFAPQRLGKKQKAETGFPFPSRHRKLPLFPNTLAISVETSLQGVSISFWVLQLEQIYPWTRWELTF